MRNLIRDQGGGLLINRGPTGGTTVSATLPAREAAMPPEPEPVSVTDSIVAHQLGI